MNQVVEAKITVEASVAEVWQAWTSKEGIVSFFSPACNIEMKVGGAYEMLFDMSAEPGLQGGEGDILLAIQPHKMLSFTWNAPPHLPEVRQQHTHVVVRFESLAENQTQVTLHHDGWGDSEQWNQAFAYFNRVWQNVVLPRLKYSFDVGPIDWNNLPELN